MRESRQRRFPMVRTTTVLRNEDFHELKALVEGQDRSIPWLLREAFRFSESSLQRPESFRQSLDRV